jgi:hypothetical protein
MEWLQLMWFPILATGFAVVFFVVCLSAAYKLYKAHQRILIRCPKCSMPMAQKEYDSDKDVVRMKCMCGYEIEKDPVDKK